MGPNSAGKKRSHSISVPVFFFFFFFCFCCCFRSSNVDSLTKRIFLENRHSALYCPSKSRSISPFVFWSSFRRLTVNRFRLFVCLFFCFRASRRQWGTEKWQKLVVKLSVMPKRPSVSMSTSVSTRTAQYDSLQENHVLVAPGKDGGKNGEGYDKKKGGGDVWEVS